MRPRDDDNDGVLVRVEETGRGLPILRSEDGELRTNRALEVGIGPPADGQRSRRRSFSGVLRAIQRRSLGAVCAGLAAALLLGVTCPGTPPQTAVAQKTIVAAHADVRSARVVSRAPLVYHDGADASLDRPDHVRAGSGLAWYGDKLAIVQDDANFIALLDPITGRVDAIPLPPGEDGRRVFGKETNNKPLKMDLESVVGFEHEGRPTLLAFGSGSTAKRENIVMLSDGQVRVIRADRLYAALRARTDFAGSELNIEGAADLGGTIRLFQRGNGKAAGSLSPLDATVDLPTAELLAYLDAPESSALPQLLRVESHDLGKIGGVRATFTDAASSPNGLLFLAGAEDSPNAIDDGAIAGTKLGRFDRAGKPVLIPIADAAGRPLADKLEGLAIDRRDPTRLYAVTDSDDPNKPCELLILQLAR